MSANHDAEGQVIKRLSFGDMSSHQVLQGEDTTCQKVILGRDDGSAVDHENDENTVRGNHRGQGSASKTLRNKQMDYQRALEEIRPTSSRFNAIQEAARAGYRETGPGKLASLKDQFSKSKFEYVELETKEHFVRAIAEEGDRVLAGEEVKGSFLLEGVVGNQKAKVQELKKLKEQTGLAINNIIDQIAAEMCELEKEQHVVATELEVCEDALQKWERLQEALAAAQSGENKEDLEELHSQQEAQLQRLAEQDLSAQQAGARTKEDADHIAEQIAELQEELREAEVEGLRLEQAAEQVGRVSKSTEVYEEMLKLMHDLAGVKVTESTDNQLHLWVTTHISAPDRRTGRRKQASIEHSLMIDLDANSAVIKGAELKPADVDISDIVATVRDTQRFDVLVREMRQRIGCYALRQNQVKRARLDTRYKMLTNRTNIIQVAIPATNILAYVDAPYDWPTPGVALRLARLLTRAGKPAFNDEVFQIIMDQVNKSSAALEGDLIPFLQGLELKLQNAELI